MNNNLRHFDVSKAFDKYIKLFSFTNSLQKHIFLTHIHIFHSFTVSNVCFNIGFDVKQGRKHP